MTGVNALTWPSVITACLTGSLLAADTPAPAPATPEQVKQAIRGLVADGLASRETWFT